MNFDNTKKYAVFIDIDGTLMGESDAAFRKNLAVISALRSMGHKVFISTGRAPSYMPAKVRLTEDYDGFITGAGAYVRLGSKELLKKLMPYAAVKKICRFFLENKVPGALEGVDNMFYFGDMRFREPDWIKLVEADTERLAADRTPILKFTVDGRVPSEVMKSLGDAYKLTRHPAFDEITQKNCTKADGIKLILDGLGLPAGQSIAIGDSPNDSEMIEFAGIGIAMGNAVDEIKQKADMITSDVESAGVAAALEKLFGI